jgi:hypothetical protein
LLSANAPVASKRWVVTGIPVFQAEVPVRIRAALMFRGQADGPLYMAGVTHLVEHLVLAVMLRSAGFYQPR